MSKEVCNQEESVCDKEGGGRDEMKSYLLHSQCFLKLILFAQMRMT